MMMLQNQDDDDYFFDCFVRCPFNVI